MTRLHAATIGAVAYACISATGANAVDLSTFGVLAGSTITNTGTTTIDGNVGLSPGSAIVGFPPASVTPPYAIYQTDAVATQAKVDLVTLYNLLAARPVSHDLSGQDLGGQTLTAGVYKYDTSAQLTGTLTLDGGGNSNSVFIIVVGSTLTTAGASSVVLTNGAKGNNVYFVVGSSATLGTTTTFTGSILALTSITLTTGANINCGAALARNGAVTLDTNTISVPDVACSSTTFVLPAGTFGTTLALSANATANEAAVAAAIDSFGGTLPLAFQFLATLTPDQLATALSQLSGEAGTAVAPAGIQAMNSFLSLLLDSGVGNGRTSPGITTAAPATVKTLDYASETPRPINPAFAAFDKPLPEPHVWSVWGAAYGGQSNTAGNASVGSHDRSASTFGFATGFDTQVTGNTKVGLALAGGGTSFGVSDGLGGGNSQMFQTAIYSRTNFHAAYVAGALAYAFQQISTSRYSPIAGDTFKAAFDAQNVAAQIEAGYRFGWITPFVSLRAQAFYTPAYGETAASGASAFALNYAANSTFTGRSELGAQVDKTIALKDDATLALRARLAWAHDYWSNTSVAAMFQSLPGPSFTVNGAAPPSDLLLISAGAEVGLKNGFSLGGSVDSELAAGSQTYSGTARLAYKW